MAFSLLLCYTESQSHTKGLAMPEKKLEPVEDFVAKVNKKDKVSGLKLRLPVTRRKRKGK